MGIAPLQQPPEGVDPELELDVLGARGEARRRGEWLAGRAAHGLRQPTFVAGCAMAAVAVLVAVLAPVIATRPPTQLSPDLLAGPSWHNLFGTDELGRDVFSRVVYAARTSLLVAFLASLLALVIGSTLGMVAGFFGGVVNTLVMRVVDMLLAFPAILFAVALVAAVGPSTRNLVITIGILYSPRFARLARGSTLSVKEREFVAAARALGASSWRIIRVHVLPNISAPLIVETSLSMTIALLTEAALSFLGLGIQPPQPSWGSMISGARPNLLDEPWVAIFPGLAIMFVVLAFNFLGDGLRDVLDPRLRRSRGAVREEE